MEKGKRNPKLSDEWLRSEWNLRALDHSENELAEFDQRISSAVARCLKDQNRVEIADDLSTMFGEEISVHMLNAYASEARNQHKIPASRFIALIAVTRRFDILDAILREVGGKALDEQEASVFRVGKSYVASLTSALALREDVAGVFGSREP